MHRTRPALVESLDLQRYDVRPDTRLDSIRPRAGRRRLWQVVQTQSGLSFPVLRNPGWVVPTLCALTCVPSVILASEIPMRSWSLMTLALMGILALATGSILLVVAGRLANRIPTGVTSVGDLAKEVLAINYPRIARQSERKSGTRSAPSSPTNSVSPLKTSAPSRASWTICASTEGALYVCVHGCKHAL